MYKGNKPCSGCNKPGNERPRISVDHLCHDCRSLIQLGEKTREANELLKDYVTVHIYPTYNTDVKECEKIFKEYKKVCLSIEDQTKKVTAVKSIGHYNSHGSFTVTLSIQQYEALKLLYNQIIDSLSSVHKKGKEEGSNLLVSLNNGDLTMQKFYDNLK